MSLVFNTREYADSRDSFNEPKLQSSGTVYARRIELEKEKDSVTLAQLQR